MEENYLYQLAELVLRGELLRYFLIVKIEHDSTLFRIHLDEKMEKQFSDDVHFASKGFIDAVEVTDKVEEVTLDLSDSMRKIVRHCFPQAKRVIDRFHIQKLACDAVRQMRIDYRRDAIQEANDEMEGAKLSGKKYIPTVLPNGDTKKEWVSGFSGLAETESRVYFANLNIKNLMSPTPRNWALKALIFALKDSADALVSLRWK